MDIIVVGGGIGGLTLALSLHAQRLSGRVRVFEAAEAFKELGVGINMLPHAVSHLAELGLLDALAKVAVEAREFLFFTHNGQLVYQEPAGLWAGYKWPHYSVHRADLHRILLDAARERVGAENIVSGHRCVGIDQDEHSATVHFVDPAGAPLPPVRGDVVIGCDGIHSNVRQQFYPDEGPPVFHDINVWRGVTRTKPFITGASVTRVGGLYTTGKVGIYPIRNDIDGKGNQLINWFVELVSNERHPVDWSKPGRLEDFYPNFKDWSFEWLDVAGLIRDADFIITYPMVDRNPVDRWTFGRVTLLGDAAHPMYPRGGNGGAQAIIDAVTLARLLKSRSDPLAALAEYQELRLPVTNRIVLQNRTAPPDIIIDTVEKLTGGKRFQHIDDVISQNELRAMSEQYQRVAGYDLDTVGRR